MKVSFSLVLGHQRFFKQRIDLGANRCFCVPASKTTKIEQRRWSKGSMRINHEVLLVKGERFGSRYTMSCGLRSWMSSFQFRVEGVHVYLYAMLMNTINKLHSHTGKLNEIIVRPSAESYNILYCKITSWLRWSFRHREFRPVRSRYCCPYSRLCSFLHFVSRQVSLSRQCTLHQCCVMRQNYERWNVWQLRAKLIGGIQNMYYNS